MARIDFNANEVPPNDFNPIPAGDYLCIMTGSEWKETKEKTGEFLEFTFKVLAGQYKDRTVKSRLNLKNQSETTVRIARGELSSICRAVNVMTPKDTTQLHNIPLIVTVAVTNKKDDGKVYNEIRGYSKRPIPEAQDVEIIEPAGAKPAWMG